MIKTLASILEAGEAERLATGFGFTEGPLWHPDGTALYYRIGDAVMAVSVEMDPTFSVGVPEVLFTGSFWSSDQSRPNYDIHPDGQRFLMMRAGIERGDSAESSSIIVVQNWLTELERLAPTND